MFAHVSSNGVRRDSLHGLKETTSHKRLNSGPYNQRHRLGQNTENSRNFWQISISWGQQRILTGWQHNNQRSVGIAGIAARNSENYNVKKLENEKKKTQKKLRLNIGVSAVVASISRINSSC